MRVLVLGASGMLGHALVRELSICHEVHGAHHGRPLRPERGVMHHNAVDITEVDTIKALLDAIRPASVINAAGVVKQRNDGAAAVIAVNALAPHQLAELCVSRGISLIHFSTDCVFSGSRGHYSETDQPDPVDLYGRSKLLGEVAGDGVLALRTSIVGLELGTHRGLVEWFLRQRGLVPGYQRAIFSGLTTLELSRIVRQLYALGTLPAGLLHVAADRISKFDLLTQLAERLPWVPVEIEPAGEPVLDRTLCGQAFCRLTGYVAPSWQTMLDELARAIEARRSGG
jgi:dTDP-4-dehydrorhamnose reductase